MASSTELDIADDIDASTYFSLPVLNNGVTQKISEPFAGTSIEQTPRRSLFAISSQFGIAIAATSNGFAVFALSTLRQTYTEAKQRTQASPDPLRHVQIGDGGITFLKFGMADKVVIASGPATQGSIAIWRLKSLVDGSDTRPIHGFPPQASAVLLDVLPNPSDRPELLALLYQTGQITMLDLEAKSTTSTFGQHVTAACWSVKGKQLVCGDAQGNLTQYTPEGEAKTVTEAPPSLRDRSMHVLDIRWVENSVFFATYLDPENPMDTSIFVSTRAKDGSITYSPILDPLMVETMDRPESRYNVWLKSWAPFRHLLLLCNATSNTISHVGLGPIEEGSSTEVWSNVKNDLYTTLPLETYPVGFDIDLSVTEPPPQDANIGDKALPLLWAYASDGTLSAWYVANKTGERYPTIAEPRDVVTQEDSRSSAAAVASSSSQPPVNVAEATSNASSASPFAFGGTSKTFGGSGSGFGSTSFASTPTFGGTPAFGKPPSFAPAFGQSGLGGGSATPTSFGKPGFGQSSSTGGGFASFSAQSSGFNSPAVASTSGSPFASGTATPAEKPVFAAHQPTAFGASTFGTSSKLTSNQSVPEPAPSGSGTLAFGQGNGFGASNTTTSPFGFGSKAPASTFGTATAASDVKTSTSIFGAGLASRSSASSSASEPRSAYPFGTSPTSSFSALRAEVSTENGRVESKPPGLNEDDADTMEPEVIATQSGGALDFGDKDSDDEQTSSRLSLGGLAFGDKPKPSTTSSSPFGFPVDANSGTGFSAPKISNTSNTESAFSFAKPSSSTGELQFASKGAGNTSSAPPAPSKATPPAASGSGAATAFGQSAFGRFSAPGQSSSSQGTAFGQASAFGSPSSFGQSPKNSPAFTFDKSAGEAAGFATTSASTGGSPFASPSPSPSPAFGHSSPIPFAKPGLFGGFHKSLSNPQSDQHDTKPLSAFATQFNASESNARQSNDTKTDVKESFMPEQGNTSEVEGSSVATYSQAGSVGGSQAEHTDNEHENAEERVSDSEESAISSHESAPVSEEDTNEWQHEGNVSEGGVDEEEEHPGDVEEAEEAEEEEEEEAEEEEEEEEAEYGQEDGLRQEQELVVGLFDGGEEEEEEEEYGGEDGLRQEQELEVGLFDGGEEEEEHDDDHSETEVYGEDEVSDESSEPSNGELARSPPKSTIFGSPAPAPAPALQAQQDTSDRTPKASVSNPFASTVATKPYGNSQETASSNVAAPTPMFPFARPSEGPKPFGFSNLQKATPRTSSPLASLPVFAAPASPSQTQSSFDLSGLSSAPSSPSASPSKAPPALLKTQSAPVLETSRLPDGPDRTPVKQTNAEQSMPPRVPISALAETQPISNPPKLSSSLPKDRPAPEVSQQTLGILVNMQEHIDALKESASSCVCFFHSVQPSRLPRNVHGDVAQLLAYEGPWGMGDLPHLQQIIKTISRKLSAVSQQAREEEKSSRALESSLLKTKAKSEEIKRYIRARDDPEVAKMVRVRQLGPEQLENQACIRRQSQNVNEALDELDRTVTDLKNKALEEKLGRSPLQAPSLDAIYRSIRNVTTALQRKLVDLDDIALRLDLMTMSTTSPARSSTLTPRRSANPASTTRAESQGSLSLHNSAISNGSTDNELGSITRIRIQRSVQRTLAADELAEKLRTAWLSNGRKKPLLNTSANDPSR